MRLREGLLGRANLEEAPSEGWGSDLFVGCSLLAPGLAHCYSTGSDLMKSPTFRIFTNSSLYPHCCHFGPSHHHLSPDGCNSHLTGLSILTHIRSVFEAEPRMEILMHVIYWGDAPKRREGGADQGGGGGKLREREQLHPEPMDSPGA